MTTNQNNKLRMGDAVMNVLTENAPVYQTNPVFITNVERHETNRNDVRHWRDKQEERIAIKGLTRDKSSLRDLMVYDEDLLISAIKTYANETGNQELYELVNFSPSELRRMKENRFVAASTNVNTVLTTHAVPLQAYGITDEMRTKFAADITAFQNIMSRTRTMISGSSVFTKNLQMAVKKMMTHLKQILDNNIRQYKTSHPDFVQAYFNSRIIVDYGNTHTGIHGRITDSKTDQKLKGVIVRVLELEDTWTATDRNGMYRFKSLPAGTYTLTFRAEGYIPMEIPDVKLEQGKYIVKDFTIEHQPVGVPAFV